jgi:transcriptional regulator GlxA family with amidase domain
MLYRPVPASAGRLTVTVLVFPGVRLLDVAGPIEVFASANDFGGRYDVRRVSADGKDVITSAGMRVSVDLAVAEADQGCDVLVIPGGPEWDGLIKDEALLETIQRLHENARCTVSVCAGAFLLAAAGLLDGRRAATHWRFSRELKMRFPKVHVEPDAIFVRDAVQRAVPDAALATGDASPDPGRGHRGAGAHPLTLFPG